MGWMRRCADLCALFGGKVRESGLCYAAYLAARAVLPRAVLDFRRAVIIACDLGTVSLIARDDPDIREITEDDLGTALDPGDVGALMRGQLRAGRRIWVVDREGRIVAHDILGADCRAISDWLDVIIIYNQTNVSAPNIGKCQLIARRNIVM